VTSRAETTADPTPGIGYEQARAELADVVARLEAGAQSLEESLALWARGEELADICQRWLSGAAARLAATIAAHDAAGDGADDRVADDGVAGGATP
jgi:exodeoxyribonuclease VII small subunit